MSFPKQSNKRPVESFIVAKTSQALYNTGGATNHINNTSTGAVRLADGQIGVFDALGLGSNALNTAITSGNTRQHSPAIFIAQGTANSASPSTRVTYPLWSRPFERTAIIEGQTPIIATKQAYVLPTFSIWNVGAPSGTGVITAADNTEYSIKVGARGTRINQSYHSDGTQSSTYSYVTPNYTALATAQPVDHLLQNLVWEVDRNSDALNINRSPLRGHDPVIAFAIMTAGGSGTAIGGVDPLAAGDFLPVVNTSFGVKGITLTEAQAESIKAAALAQAGGVIADLTWTILTVDLATAGTTTGGVANMVMLMGLDGALAYDDKMVNTKTRLIVGLSSGFDFNTVALTQYSFASEGSGSSRYWDLLYKATQGQRKYSLNHVEDPVINFASPIVADTKYVAYAIQHSSAAQIDTSNVSESPKMEYILIPSSETTLISAFDTLMNAWLISATGFGIKSI